MLKKKNQEVPRSIFVGVASNLFSPQGGTSSQKSTLCPYFFFQLIFLKISAEAPAVDVFLTFFFYMGVPIFSIVLMQSEVHMTVQSILTWPEKYIPDVY